MKIKIKLGGSPSPDVMENLKKLPPFCFKRSRTKPGEVILIRRGVMGYFPQTKCCDPDELNRMLGITPAQVAAMEAGSVFGWHVPAANPDDYEDDDLPL